MLKRGLGKAVLLILWVLAGMAGLSSCDTDQANGHGRKGALRLSLLSDTTGIKGGLISTKSGNEFDDFLNVDAYTVHIVAGEDTLTSLLYKDFPEEIAIEEGNYTLVASKGENSPAAFDNPYFEGSREFTIKEEMKTPLEVTCTMANARIKAEYSEDFLKAYTDYTLMLKTPKMDNPFLVSKDETRFAYLQTGKEGEKLTVAISLKRATWTEAKVYTVTDPAITLNPKETVTLKFATDGKTGDGLGLSIVLDDQLTEVELKDTVPDFMWKPFDKPTLQATNFENKEHVEISSAGLDVSPYLAFGVPSGIGSFMILRTEVGSSDTVKYDIATSAGAAAAKGAGFDWGGVNLFNYKKTSQLKIEEALKNLPYIGEKEYAFTFFIKDNLPVTNYTDTVQLFVHRFYATPTIKLSQELPAEIWEGEALKTDVIAKLDTDAGIQEVSVTIKDGKGNVTKYTGEQLNDLGATLKLENEKTGTLTIPKGFTQKLNALAAEDQVYEFEIELVAKDGTEKNVSYRHTLLVKCPKFQLIITPNEGDIFAKRAILRADLTAGLSTRFKFQQKVGNDWKDISADREQDGTVVIDTLKGLMPATGYTVRAVYENGKNRVSGEYSFATEGIGVLPNAGMEEWTVGPDGLEGHGDYRSLGIFKDNAYTRTPFRSWERWYPYTMSNKGHWDTLNEKTTSEGSESEKFSKLGTGDKRWTRYVANSGTIRTSDKHSGSYAALVRSVGWGEGSTAGGDGSVQKKADPGFLYLGTYNKSTQSGDYGIEFNSRPLGLSFYCKYSSKSGNDRFIAKMVILDDENNIIAEGELPESELGTISNYTKRSIQLVYKSSTLKAKSIYIVFQSGTRLDKNELLHASEDFYCPALANLTDGEFVGSQLYIDDIELIYE